VTRNRRYNQLPALRCVNRCRRVALLGFCMPSCSPMLSRPLFVIGLSVVAVIESLLRHINVYEPLHDRPITVFRLVPRTVRALVLSVASGSFSYFLAQFLALLSVFLTSAFIQLTLKVIQMNRCFCFVLEGVCSRTVYMISLYIYVSMYLYPSIHPLISLSLSHTHTVLG
jgi:hypothetical protein